MHILYIAQNYQPMNASSITTHEIIRKLAERGQKITLLAPQRCSKKCIPDCSLACKDDSNVIVIRVPTLVPYYLINRYSSIRALTLAFCQLFMALKASKICSGKKVEIIVSQHHPSHLASLSAFIPSRIFKLPLIIKTHDVFNSSSIVFNLRGLLTTSTRFARLKIMRYILSNVCKNNDRKTVELELNTS